MFDRLPELALLPALITALAGQAPAGKLPQDRLDAEARGAVVERLSTLLVESYVFPDVATQCALRLDELATSGAFDAHTDPGAFAQALTAALQAVSKDKHMRVVVRPPQRAQLEDEDPLAAQIERMESMRASNFGFARVERLDGNVGYIDMRSFQPVDFARNTAAAALAFVENTDAIIFDMRQNGGGSPDLIQFICSYFFEEPTHLNSLYWRKGDVTQEFWTLPEIPGTRRPLVPLFVLTSNYTFSGAEEFTYNLKTRERATIIGETTGGGANPGGTVPIDSQFAVFIPTGRAINPITKTNWEGVGVEPDIAVTASAAYDVALDEAIKAARNYSEYVRGELKQLRYDMLVDLDGARNACAQGKRERATSIVQRTLSAAIEANVLDERSINRLGYQALGNDDPEFAVILLEANARAFPRSANVWDSLAEAHDVKGDKQQAVANYRKSLELEPENARARERVEELEAE